ncbi:MAG: phage tail protein [Pseudomonadota bacterium]
MSTFEVRLNQDQVQDAISLFEFFGGNTPDALRIAINRTGPKVKQAASVEIRKQVRLRAAYVKDDRQLRFIRATRQKVTGRLRANSRGILLTRYSTDPLIASQDRASWFRPPPTPARGIRVKVKPTGSTKVMEGGWFYMVLPNSRALAIVRRRPKGSLGPQGGKIDVAYGPSVSQVFGNETRDRLLPKAEDDLSTELLRAMGFLLRKQSPRE